jgi:membrane-bound serine protease (ClpP class)
VTTGVAGMIGEIGVAQTKLAPDGNVTVHGEIWKAISDQIIKKGEKVRVISVDGLKLKVEKIT